MKASSMLAFSTTAAQGSALSSCVHHWGGERASLEPQPGAPMAAGAKLQKGGTQAARRRQDMPGSRTGSPLDSLT